MRCEAMVERRGRSYRCPNLATDDHHMLFRSRGGDLLDRVGETYHRIMLCRRCHDFTHNNNDRGPDALVIDGYVTWDKLRDVPVYEGPDPYLLEKYGDASVRSRMDE